MTNKIEITMPLEDRVWQKEMLKGCFSRRFSVVVAHRRAGKTEAICVRLVMAALSLNRKHPRPLFAYIAPFLKQAKLVAWDRLKFYTAGLPSTKVNESELTIELFNKTKIKIFGADYPDRLRGLGFDGVVMDEVAQMRPETWTAVVRPALADREGWAIFIGTPKGQNKFYEIYQTALANPKQWYAGIFTVDKTGIIDSGELERLKTEMSELYYRQEFLCDFTVGNFNSFIDFLLVQESVRRKKNALNLAPLVFGLDPARFGDDRTVLIQRKGLEIVKIDVWKDTDLMTTASLVAEAINKEKPVAVFVDAVGLGAGVVDRLRQLGHSVLAVNSGNVPSKNIYFNLKAEMWDKMKSWLEDGGILPDTEALKEDLLAPTYDYDAQGRLKIESKDALKKRGLLSPDIADALALTFAAPVANRMDSIYKETRYAEMNY